MVPAVGANTAGNFTDEDKINPDFLRAATITTGIKIWTGYEDNTFRPEATISRAEAVTVLARLFLGPDVSPQVSTAGGASFTDVPADYYARGFISWAFENGYVKGHGDGTFGPNEPVTAVAFAAMVLRAIGYGMNGEFEGPNWQVNVMIMAMREGLFNRVDGPYTTGASRETVAQYAFNALTIPFRIFDKNRENYISAGDIYDAWVGDDAPMNVRNTVYPSLAPRNNTRDSFGRPSVTWVFKNDTIGTFREEPILKAQDSVKQRDIYRAASLDANTTANIYRDSGAVTHTAPITTDDSAIDVPAGVLSRGVDIEVYKFRDQIDIIIINTFIGKVVEVNNADEFFKRNIVIEVYPGGAAASYKLEKYETTDFAKDDIVLVKRTINNVARDVKKAVPESNKAISSFVNSTIATAGNVVFGGNVHRYSANFSTANGMVGGAYGWDGKDYGFSGNTYDFYLDAHGNILANERHTVGVVPLNFAYIADVDLRIGEGTGLQIARPYRAVANLIYMDGTLKTVTLRVQTAGNNVGNYVSGEAVAPGDLFINFPLDDGTPQRYFIGGRAENTQASWPVALADNSSVDGLGVLLKGRLVSYTEGDNDVVNLFRNLSYPSVNPTTFAQLHTSGNFTFKANTPNVGGIASAFANLGTKLYTRASNTVTPYEGFDKFPAGNGWPHTATVSKPVITVRTGTMLTNILVIDEAVPGPEPKVEAFAVWTGGIRTVAEGTEYQFLLSDGSGAGWYRLHGDGEVTSGVSRPALYTVKRQSGNQIILDNAKVTLDSPATINRVDAAEYFVYNGEASNTPLFASDIVIFNVNDLNAPALVGVGALAKDCVVQFVTDTNPDRVIAIMITTTP
jgi:hypothetical protein